MSQTPPHHPSRLVAGRGAGAVRTAVHRPAAQGPAGAPRAPRAEHGADEHTAVDQDRGLPGGLRLLPAERALRHRRRGRGPDAGRGGARGGRARQGRRRHALLHGRGLPLAQGARAEGDRPDDRRGARARAGELRHPGDAHAGAGAGTQGRGPGLLQPQPRHLRGVLRHDHQHAHLRGPPGHPRGGARGGPEGVLRRHHRHGRVGGRPRATAAHARQPAPAPRERAHQPAGAGRRHAARRMPPPSTRSTSCASSPWRASSCPPRTCACPPGARR